MRRGYDYNLIVIGGGSAGVACARLAASLKAKVALVEKARLGGDCLHTGCVPSKTLLKSAKVFSLRHRAADFGIGSISMEMDFPLVMERVKRVIGEVAPYDPVVKFQSQGISVYEGEARILSRREVVVNGKLLRTRAIIVATGAQPALPPIEGLSEMAPLTSENVWALPSLPRRLLVLGGGAIGCELAQAFQRFGSQVTLVERNERVLPRDDKEVGELMQARFEAEGMRLVLSAGALRFSRQEGTKVVECENGTRVEFDEVLVALGRRPSVKGLGLEEVGVKLRSNGGIETDLSLRTSVPGIYAVGDVTGMQQFVQFAHQSASIATRNALFSPWRRRANLAVFPWAVFTDPEVARVGLNETDAKARGIAYEVSRFDFARSDRALTENEGIGFVKVLTRPGSDRVLGATIVGPSAGELIQEFTLAMKFRIGLAAIRATTHAYPTLMEANQLAAGVWKRAHAPLRGWMPGFHRLWRKLP
jgi:pyruvate/2-oxoglutarate dehydrogenase complex dihydrolipoamide dehydrogenase (E3) component